MRIFKYRRLRIIGKGRVGGEKGGVAVAGSRLGQRKLGTFSIHSLHKTHLFAHAQNARKTNSPMQLQIIVKTIVTAPDWK